MVEKQPLKFRELVEVTHGVLVFADDWKASKKRAVNRRRVELELGKSYPDLIESKKELFDGRGG